LTCHVNGCKDSVLLTCSSQPKHSAAAEQYFDGSWRRTDFDLGYGDSYSFSHEVVAFRACHARTVPGTPAQGLMSYCVENAFTFEIFMIARGMSKTIYIVYTRCILLFMISFRFRCIAYKVYSVVLEREKYIMQIATLNDILRVFVKYLDIPQLETLKCTQIFVLNFRANVKDSLWYIYI
jgi:hypothetical protein